VCLLEPAGFPWSRGQSGDNLYTPLPFSILTGGWGTPGAEGTSFFLGAFSIKRVSVSKKNKTSPAKISATPMPRALVEEGSLAAHLAAGRATLNSDSPYRA
jgi:hypothetical protein